MTIESQQKSFVLTALALAPTVWMLSFNYGVYKTVFFNHLFVIWAISIAALICGFLVRLDEQLVSFSTFKGRCLLILPTIWVFSGYWVNIYPDNSVIYWMDLLLTLATVLLSLPYLLYYVILILVPGAESINSKKLLFSLILITVMMGSFGYFVGHYHPRFLFCETFAVAGNNPPENCWPQAKSR